MVTDPQAIADSLTKAQREAVRTSLFFGAELRASLADKHLIETRHDGCGVTVKVLPLGLAVRQILKDEQ